MKRISLFFLLVLFVYGTQMCFAQNTRRKTINIWSGVRSLEGERVLLELAFPAEPNGTAVIICPGGSYHHLGFFGEGRTTAQWFCQQGVTTAILSYRVAQDRYHYPAPMQDVQRALQIMRERSEEFGIDAEKIGLIGFSAGGHLVAWAAEVGDNNSELQKVGIYTATSVRPNFVIPVYPVISMQDDIGHKRSRKSLLGKNPPQEQKDAFSLELQVPSRGMPPVYLVACRDDPVVLYENSERFYAALQQQGVDCTFARYDWGGHGFGMKDNAFMKAFHWNEDLALWLRAHGFLP